MNAMRVKNARFAQAVRIDTSFETFINSGPKVQAVFLDGLLVVKTPRGVTLVPVTNIGSMEVDWEEYRDAMREEENQGQGQEQKRPVGRPRKVEAGAEA